MKWKVTALACLVSSLSALAGGRVTLHVELSPAGSFEASSEKLEGQLIKKKDHFFAEKISVNIQSLKTGIDLRDEHFWKHLNSSKFSNAVITKFEGQEGEAVAFLEVAGVKKSIKVTYKDSGDEIIGKFKVSNSHFNLPVVEYMGIGVEDEVECEVRMTYNQI
jgi:hypothetical protein